MKLARAFLFASTAVGAVIWSACVGDDPTTPSADAGGPGSLDQPCFGNGTCNSGLSCISNVCVDLDGAGGDDSSTGGDDASKARLDGGFVCDAGPLYSNAKSIPCPAPEADCVSGTAECCAQGSDTVCPALGSGCSVSTGADIDCIVPSHCSTGNVCCLGAPNAAAFADLTCPRTATLNEGVCASSCSGGQRQACVLDKDCPPAMTCHPTQITYNHNTLASPPIIGLCAFN